MDIHVRHNNNYFYLLNTYFILLKKRMCVCLQMVLDLYDFITAWDI
jgi:hypothetical protein